MKRIVVSLSKLDIETETTFGDLMGENGIAFWHRFARYLAAVDSG